ncbi:MAG: DUF2079 domain-containing protein [Anaerolineae bacterium]|nr:DUF2079 domain-containing protein [Anaerolineae bacterium]MDH7472447.1 DUF2079 domain-containing protein [Anaerolineae bacterium]
MTHGFDLGNVDQAVWNTLHGRFLRMTNEEGTESRLGTHFDPIIALLAPLYLIHSGPETLLVVQTIALALGAWPIFWLAKKKLENAWAAAAFALVYLAFPALEGANLSEFHAVTLGSSFLAWAFYFLHLDRPYLFGLFTVLAMSCKEEIPLIVAMMGLYAFFVLRKQKLGLVTLLSGILWFIIAVKVVIPSFNESGRSIHLAHYGYLGDSVEKVLINVVTRPELVFSNFKDKLKVAYLLKLCFPVGYLSLLAPQVLLIAIPAIAINFLSTHYTMYALDMFWGSVTIVPFVVLSAVWGTALLAHMFHRLLKVKRGFVVAVFTIYALTFTAFYHQRLGYSPLSQNLSWPQITAHHRLGERLARSIPRDAVVVAQDHLNSHVSERETVYIFPYNIDEADYVFLDVAGQPGYLLGYDEYHAAVDQTLSRQDFGVVAGEDGYIILKKGAKQVPLSQDFYSFLLADGIDKALPLTVDFGAAVRLSGLCLEYQRGMIVEVHSYWQANRTPQGDPRVFLCLVDEEGVPLPGTAIEVRASIWYPPTRWTPQQIVHSTERVQLPAYVDLSTISLGFFVGPPAAIDDVNARLSVVIEDAGSVKIDVKRSVLVIPMGTRTD